MINEFQFNEIKEKTVETLQLLLITSVLILVLGIIIGCLLYLTDRRYFEYKTKKIDVIHQGLSVVVNALRTIPFIVLAALLIPVNLNIMGTFIGVKGAIIPIVLSAAPFFARITYNSLISINAGVNEALRSMGASKLRVICTILKESLPALIEGFTLTLITLVGFITVAGAIGAGGLGDLAQRYFFNGGDRTRAAGFLIVVILLSFVFTTQIIGDLIAKKIRKKRN